MSQGVSNSCMQDAKHFAMYFDFDLVIRCGTRLTTLQICCFAKKSTGDLVSTSKSFGVSIMPSINYEDIKCSSLTSNNGPKSVLDDR